MSSRKSGRGSDGVLLGKRQGPLRRKSGEDVKAVIDIGSNSIKLRVARRSDGALRTLLDTTEVVGLGRGMEEGRLREETMQNGVAVIERLVKRAAELGARPRLVGTMALRTACNAGEFAEMIRVKTSLPLEIISGEEEACLAWKGAVSAFRKKGSPSGVPLVVFDTGGGSTEFVFGMRSAIEYSRSVPIGAVSLTERFFPMDPATPDALREAQEHVRAVLETERLRPNAPASLVGLGGGVIAMASVKCGMKTFMPLKLNGAELTRTDVETQVKLFAARTVEERKTLRGLPPRRADIILASACIVQGILETLGSVSFTVSINGLRHGLLLQMFGV